MEIGQRNKMAQGKQLAVVLVRGLQSSAQEVKDTLKMLNILRRNVCVIIPATPSFIGMINKVRNYITYGEVSEETVKLLKEKKGDGSHFNLNSPRKGYGRKGVKVNFAQGGALGYRGEKMNDLLRRMI
jgi:large subunit ribosomal protein L30